MAFIDDWKTLVKDKKTVLCAGLDPADFEMGRGAKSLPEGVDKLEWALDYMRAVAPFSAALKYNLQYWKNKGGMNYLGEISSQAEKSELLLIDDSKLADIGSTNEAGVFYAGKRPAHAVTFSPFAGNMEEVAQQGEKHNVGIISMCLMSNPEYAREKHKLVTVKEGDNYYNTDIVCVDEVNHVFQYIQLAHDAKKFGIEGLVIGAPSDKNHIEAIEIAKVRKYFGDSGLILLPGVGHQGGEADAIWKYFGFDEVILNVSRSLMFPNNNNKAGKQEHAETARQYKDMLNKLRGAA